MSSYMRLIGGGASLNQLVNDMNGNILIYNAEHASSSLQIAGSGIASGTAVVSSNVTITVPHTLGYTPRALVWYENASYTSPLPAHFEATLGSGVTYATTFEYVTTPISLIIYMRLGSASTYAGVQNFSYVLLKP